MSMSEWQKYKLGEVYSFSSGLSKSSDQFGYGFDFLTFKDVFNNYFLPDKLTALVNSTEKERQTCSIKRGDVFLTRTSETDDELGMSSVALKDYPNATFNGFTKRLRPLGNVEIYPEFVAYYFRSPRFRANIVGMSSITTRASLNNSMLAELPLLLPNYEEQVRIATILKCLDDKIDLLHRENKTLETMAETLFRQWFIEEAKEDDMCLLGEVIKTTSGGTPSRKNEEYYCNGNIEWVKSKELHHSYILDTEEKITVEAVHNSSAKLLPENSILIAMYGATVGEYGIIAKSMTCNQAICALIPNEKYPYTYLYLWAKFMQDEFINLACGAAQQNISQELIKQQYVSNDIKLISDFHILVNPYMEKMKVNQEQIQTLIQQRDSLLSKLMSGEVKI
jgi:type I restriction enzyme S subunit